MPRDEPNDFDRQLLDEAVRQAEKSWNEGGIPIGAAIGRADLSIVGAGHNTREQTGDPTAHAEIVCIRDAGRRRDWHTLTLASTLSPCIMCSGAALLHRIPRVVIGESDSFLGAEDLMHEKGVALVQMRDERCIALMTELKRLRPDIWGEDIGEPPDPE